MAALLQEPIITSLRLSKALGLARQGKMREAQQLFAAEGTLPESSLELHALAALATGDGDYARALRLWRLLLQREPGHAEAKHMIDTIELWLSRPAWFSYLPIGATIAGLGIFFVTIAWILTGDDPAVAKQTPAQPPRPAAAVAPAYVPSSAPPPAITLPNMNAPASSQQRRNRSR